MQAVVEIFFSWPFPTQTENLISNSKSVFVFYQPQFYKSLRTVLTDDELFKKTFNILRFEITRASMNCLKL